MGMYRPSDDAVILKVVDGNPKRKGSAAHARFALYVPSMTVGEFIRAGGLISDIYWDISRAYIVVSYYPYAELAQRF